MNPFKFGTVVTGEYFTNRTREIKQVVSDIKSGQHLVLISPRRYGKTSLIDQVIAKLKMPYLKINMEVVTGEIDFANYYVEKTLSLNPIEKIKHYLKNFTIQPSIQLKPEDNEFSITFNASQGKISSLLRDSFELPETVAKKLKKRILVVFDEFQDIRRISANLERQMRGIFQEHKNIVYVFIGSQESMIRDIFQNKNNPFYRFGRQVTLSEIQRSEFKDFIINRFDTKKIDCSNIVDEILDFTCCHPYYTQQLCYEVYNIAIEENKIKENIIPSAVRQVINEHSSHYNKWWNKLSNTERKIIIGIVSGNNMPTSQEFIIKYGIKSTSTSGSAVSKLINEGVLIKENGGCEIEDPFLKKWVWITRSQ